MTKGQNHNMINKNAATGALDFFTSLQITQSGVAFLKVMTLLLHLKYVITPRIHF